MTAAGGVWIEHYAHDRRGRALAGFAGYEEARAWKRRLHESLSTRYVETSFGDLQCAWDGDGPGMAEVLVERLRAKGVEIAAPERWTVEAADDIGDGPDAGPGPLTLEVGAWIGAVRRRPAGRPPPTGRADVEALRRIGGAAELGPTATPTTAAVLAAFAYWIPDTSRETEGETAEPVTVLVMGRRNIDVSDPPPDGRSGAGLDRRRRNAAARQAGIEVEYRTIHAAKGGEADYAVLIDSGVPSSATAPAQLALDRATAAETGRGRDDEHQLWYVALTRARYAALTRGVRPRRRRLVR